MNEQEEQAYCDGQRSAWSGLLGECLKQLGYHDDPDALKLRWIMEREAAIVQLRMVCRDHGDNDWKPDLHLGDIIEKHLANHLG